MAENERYHTDHALHLQLLGRWGTLDPDALRNMGAHTVDIDRARAELFRIDKPEAPIVTSLEDMLWRIEGNYLREGSGPRSRFAGLTLQRVQARAMIRAVLTWAARPLYGVEQPAGGASSTGAPTPASAPSTTTGAATASASPAGSHDLRPEPSGYAAMCVPCGWSGKIRPTREQMQADLDGHNCPVVHVREQP